MTHVTEVEIVLYRGRKENEAGRFRLPLAVVPRQGEFIHRDGLLYEIKQVTWDFAADPPVAAIIGSLSFGGVQL